VEQLSVPPLLGKLLALLATPDWGGKACQGETL